MRSLCISHIIVASLVSVFLLSCGNATGSKDNAPIPNGPSGSNENLGNWVARTTGTSTNLNDVAFFYGTGIIAVGDAGTVLVSKDKGQTWETKDLGTKANLRHISWVNDVVFIGGENIVLMSKDKGNTFVKAGEVSGNIVDMDFTSSRERGDSFWAVGTEGLALVARLGEQELEDFAPESMTWKKVEISGSKNLTGVSFSFEDGLVIGDNGFLVQTSNGGETFEPVTNISTEANLLTIDDEVIGGEGVIARRDAISGMPVGSYKWSLDAYSNFPVFRDFNCLSECMAVGSNNGGSLVVRISRENEIIETQASGIRSELRAITRITGDSYVAVGTSGAVLVLDKAE